MRSLLLVALLGCGDGVGTPIERGRHTLEGSHATIGVPAGWSLDPEAVPVATMRNEGELSMVYLGDVSKPRAVLMVGRLESLDPRLDCDEAERLAARAFEQVTDSAASVQVTCNGPGMGYVVEGTLRWGRLRWRIAARFRKRRSGRDHLLHMSAAAARDSESASRRTLALLAGVRFERPSQAADQPEPRRRDRTRSRPQRRRRRGRRPIRADDDKWWEHRDRQRRRRPKGPQTVPGF